MFAACTGALIAIAAVALLVWVRDDLHRPYAGWQGASTVVTVERGLDAGSMLARLGEAGVLRRPRTVKAWLSVRGGAERLQAGEYRFDRPLSPVAVLDRLSRGDVLLHPVTLPEGLNLVEVARRLSAAGFGSDEQLTAAFNDPRAVADLDPNATDLEGYLFPDTYHFPREQTPREIALEMTGRFRQVVGEEYGVRAEAVGLGFRDAVTLASMIEKETSVSGERPRISRVFHNRIKRGMKMECDPTVMYALHRAGKSVERLTYADLRFDSPWNTYVIGGLPAGPIANPGRASLEAALSPADGNELFFVAAPGGGHRFSKTMSGHLKAVAEWRRHVRSSR